MAQHLKQPLLTTKELTSILRVDRQWIYAQIHSGTLPFSYIKVGRLLRFPAESVETFLMKNMREPMQAQKTGNARG
jgi:excisionase family DNA binding protein